VQISGVLCFYLFFLFPFPQLLQGSPELIDTNFFTADWHMVLLSSSGNMLVPEDRKGKATKPL